jgi:hypothetical protein
MRTSASVVDDWRPLGIVAAIAVVLGFVGAYFLPGTSAISFARDNGRAELKALQPAGEVKTDDLTGFEWSGTSGEVRLVVVDASRGGAPVLDKKVEGTRYGLADAEKARLARGGEYQWFVEFKAPDGATRTAPATRFELK